MPFVDRLSNVVKTTAQPTDKWRGAPADGNDGVGLNISELGFLNSWNEGTFEVNITRERLAEIKAAGFSFARVPFNPTFLLSAADEDELAERWQGVDNAIALCLRSGLRVYLNCHVWSLPGANDWPASTILSAYPSGAAWLAFEELTSFVAEQLLKYDPADVAYGQFNEAPGSYTNWSTIAARLYGVIREVNPDITVFVSSDNYSGADNMIALDPSLFSGNVRWAVTPYEPSIFSHRRVPSTVPYDIPLSMNFPPIPSQKAAVVAAMETNVDNDSDISDKSGWKATLSGYIDDYIDNRNGLEPTWLNRKTAAIEGWCRANDIDPIDVMISEIGCSTDGVQADTPMNSNMRWFAGQRRQALRHGFGGICIWDYSINGPFSINTTSGDLSDNYLVAVGGRALLPYTGRMQRLFSLMGAGNMPSRRAQDVMNAAADRLDTLGLWAKLSLLYFWIGCSDSSDIALFNWKAPDSFKLVSSGNPVFERDKGWRSAHGKGSTAGVGDDLLNTGFIPGVSDAIYTRNANHMGLWQNDGFAEEDYSQYVVGDDFGQNFLGISNASANIGLAVTSFVSGPGSVSDNGLGTVGTGTARKGHFVFVREDASNVTAYKDGTLVAGSISSASAALAGLYPIKLLRTVRSQLGGFHMGGKLTAQEVIDLYTVFDFVAVALDDPS